MWVGVQSHATAPFTHGKVLVPIEKETGWAVLDWCGESRPNGIDPRTFQPLASRYTGP